MAGGAWAGGPCTDAALAAPSLSHRRSINSLCPGLGLAGWWREAFQESTLGFM